MSGPAVDGPLVFNVAGLLGDPVGTARAYDLDDVRIALPDELVLSAPIAGHVRLSRENRGIFASARLTTALAGECARCLRVHTLTRPVDNRLGRRVAELLNGL